MSEAVVYQMIKAFYEKRDELVKLDPGFTPMAKDFVGMQVQGIDANPQIPVHAGPRQVPEGAQGLGRQVEGRSRRDLIGRSVQTGRARCAQGTGARPEIPA